MNTCSHLPASPRRAPKALARARESGFTLVELSATMSVFAILSALAAASMSSVLGNNRVYAAQDEFVAYVAYARSEAMRRGTTVAVGASSAVSGNAFGGGWRVWVDTNDDGAVDPDETILRTHEAVPNMVVGSGSVTAFSFTSMGFLTQTAAIDVKVCPVDPTVAGFDVTIQPSGLTDIAEVTPHTSPCN
ncbi:MAG TPA: GspH/FimT family protein [Casimicrobiaceae bacterium]|nr:GspH/FimT family protein [Casimicrobiaceae bacterium]